MDKIIKIVYLVAIAFMLYAPTRRVLHMFQQNRYENKRYIDWLKTNFKRSYYKYYKVIICLVLLILIALIKDVLIKNLLAITLTVLIGIIGFLQEAKKESIKPLVFTFRVIRQFVVLVIVDAIVITFFGYTLKPDWYLLMIPIAYIMNWILIMLVSIINSPVEKMIHNGFINKAKKVLSNSNSTVIGITGSYGKTSSKNILNAILSEKYYTLMTPASFNTPMGITITIREQLKPTHQMFICEMGADHVGEIKFLADFVKPKIGIVTSIGPQHLNTFGSLQNIINEKMSLIEALPSDGVGVLNYDNEYIKDYPIKNTCKIVTYGIDAEDVDYRAINIEYSPTGSSFEVLTKDNKTTRFTTKLLGAHNIANILASIAVGIEENISIEQLQKAVMQVDYVEHRLQVKKINGYTFIDNAFNSNPVGSSMSLDVMKMMPNRRFIVTPGMIDLGEKQDEYNYNFGMLMLNKVDEVILVGKKQTKAIQDGLKDAGFDGKHIHIVDTVKEAFSLVYSLATTEDTILLENDLPDAFNQ